MAINELIARGIRPLGEGVADTLATVEQIQQGRKRNALADRNLALDESRNEMYGRQLGLQETAQRNAIKLQEDALRKERSIALIEHMRADPANVSAIVSMGKREGVIPQEVPDQLTPEMVETLAARAGLAPRVSYETTNGPRGSRIQRNSLTGEEKQIVGPDNSQPAIPASQQERFVTLTPAEVAAAGLPPGTSAQRNTLTGKVDVLSKRDASGTLSQKDQTVVRQKLTGIQLAKQQLTKIKETFGTGRAGAMNAFGPGQGSLPTQQGKAFDAAVDQMRSTLTALTRVPGVGAMSDYETKLDQAKFPARSDYETVTEQKIQGIEDMLALLENGYNGLKNGQDAPIASQPAPNQGTIDRTPAGNNDPLGIR